MKGGLILHSVLPSRTLFVPLGNLKQFPEPPFLRSKARVNERIVPETIPVFRDPVQDHSTADLQGTREDFSSSGK